MSKNCWDGRWEGGRIWRDDRGRPIYVIRKQVNGKRYEVSTRSHTERGALEQLKRFEADPESYDPRGAVRKDPVYLTEKLVRRFLTWSLHEKKNSKRWVGQQKLYLAWWADRLKGVDLRGASLTDKILPQIRHKTPARPQRIAVLKVFYSWLRKEEHLISTAEDPTLFTLSVPQSKAEQLTRVKAISRDHFLLAQEHLASDRWRDLLLVLGGTGMHVSELERFATDGTTEPLPQGARQAHGAIGQVVIPLTKGGETLRVAVSADVLAAARRVLAAGSFDRAHFQKAVKSACLAAGIPAFGPGQLRHSIATWAINAGADPASVAAFLGHRSVRTTRKFYATHATPAKIPTLI
jgi:integrase